MHAVRGEARVLLEVGVMCLRWKGARGASVLLVVVVVVVSCVMVIPCVPFVAVN